MKRRKRFDTQDATTFLSRNSDGLKINIETLRRFIREGKIKPIRGGPPYFFRVETLENFIPLLRPKGRPRQTKNLPQEGA
jgi:hypothetical protein